MEFKQAANFIIPWGDYVGKTIDNIASTDHGLKDLDCLLSWMEEKKHKSLFRVALERYFADVAIKKELETL